MKQKKNNGTERAVLFPFRSRPVIFEREPVERTGRANFLMTYTVSNGQIWRRHHDQLRSALNCDTPEY